MQQQVDTLTQQNASATQRADQLQQQVDTLTQQLNNANALLRALNDQQNQVVANYSPVQRGPIIAHYTSHPQRNDVIQNLNQPNTKPAFYASAFILNYLRDSGKFDSVTPFNITEQCNGSQSFTFNGKKYYVNKENDKHYDIKTQLSDGTEFFIIVRATKVDKSSSNELPIDFDMLKRVSREIPDADEDGETAVAVVWNADKPSPSTCVFFSESKLVKILESK